MNKHIKYLIPLAVTMLLSGCVTSSPSSSSASSSAVSSSSSSSVNPNIATAISFTDNIGSYTVGETFINVFDVSVTLTYGDGHTKDVSAKPAYFKMVIKDSSGNEIDTSEPFETAGTYTMYAVYKSNTSVVSEGKSFTVKAALTNKVTEKTDATPTFTYGDVEDSSLMNLSYPNSGTINTLVLPILIDDFPFNRTAHGENYLSAMDKVFNGDGEAETGYWESVSSYYKKSSLGKLDLEFTVADVYDSGLTSQQLNDFSTEANQASYGYTSATMINRAIENYKTINGADSVKKYDNNGDGYIDGLWAIYSAPDYASNSTLASYSNKDLFWAYCTDTTSYEANVESPTLHSYGWASYTFMNEGAVAPAVDAHTFIHETGHLLSLTDYYSYDLNSATTSGCQGGLAMMDLNIGDQDAFSKVSLGWADPYVVTDDCIVTINPNESSGDSILLADSWNGTAFDEYLLFDLQTPTGLNAVDAARAYNGRPLYFNKAGVRAYHVDARLGMLESLYTSDVDEKGAAVVSSDGTYWVMDTDAKDYYVEDSQIKTLVEAGPLPRLSQDKTINYETRTPGYSVINGNCASRSGISSSPYSDNRLLTIIQKNDKNCETSLTFANNDSLFHAGDSWSLARSGGAYFTTVPGKFNNGNELNWVVTVLACDDNSATLQFRKY